MHCAVKREIVMISFTKLGEVGGVAERFYDTHFSRSLRRFVTPGRYSIYFQKRYCITFYEQSLSNHPLHTCSGTCRCWQKSASTSLLCLFNDAFELQRIEHMDGCEWWIESNAKAAVAYSKLGHRTYLEGLRKARKTVRAKNRTCDIQITTQQY
jgi:hypothetical protein